MSISCSTGDGLYPRAPSQLGTNQGVGKFGDRSGLPRKLHSQARQLREDRSKGVRAGKDPRPVALVTASDSQDLQQRQKDR